MALMETFLFSGYARLPQDVSHQALYKRVGVVVVVDDTGKILRASTSLMMDVARDFFGEIVDGLNVVSGREELERIIRYRYRGHSQGALVSAMRKIYEAVDQSPIAARRPAAMAARRAAEDGAGDETATADGSAGI